MDNPPVPHFGGNIDVVCPFCESLSFPEEHFPCCSNGNIVLPQLPPYPPVLLDLLTGNNVQARNFRAHIRTFNNLFAFASLKVNLAFPRGRDRDEIFKICGSIAHRIGPLHPQEGHQRRYSQLYIYHGEDAVEQRVGNPLADRRLRRDVLLTIQQIMDQINPYAYAYLHMYQVEQRHLREAEQQGHNPPVVTMVFRQNIRQNNPGRYNRPWFDEVAAIFVDQQGLPPPREVVVFPHNPNHRYHFLPHNSSLLDPLCYPLLFPYGTHGWTTDIPVPKNRDVLTAEQNQ